MPDLTLDLRYLKYAVHVAEEGSFRRAAEKLSLAQSTVSRRVQLLEWQLGVPIFDRSRTGSRLTPEGQRFLSQAAVGARYLRAAATELHSGDRHSTGSIKIGLLESFPVCALVDLLGEFRHRNPTIDVKLEEATSALNAVGVQRGILDVAVVLDYVAVAELQAEHLATGPSHIAVPLQHPLADRTRLSWDDLRDQTFLVRSEEAGREVEEYLRTSFANVTGRLRLSIQQVSQEMLFTLVAQGFGLAVTSTTDRQDVAFVPLNPSGRGARSAIIWSHDNQNPALARLLDLREKLNGASVNQRTAKP